MASNMYIIGSVFLRNYYSIYDFENNRVGIALNIYSNADVRKIFPTWAIILIVVGGVLILLVIALCIWRRYRNKKLRNDLQHY